MPEFSEVIVVEHGKTATQAVEEFLTESKVLEIIYTLKENFCTFRDLLGVEPEEVRVEEIWPDIGLLKCDTVGDEMICVYDFIVSLEIVGMLLLEEEIHIRSSLSVTFPIRRERGSTLEFEESLSNRDPVSWTFKSTEIIKGLEEVDSVETNV